MLWLVQGGALALEPTPQAAEYTCFQTNRAFEPDLDLKTDVAIVYGIDPGIAARLETWRREGYRVHLMTGVSWGNYQDYLYGRFDGVNHEDEAQTDRNGNKVSHGGDVYYMSPGINYGKFLCVGVERALEAGALAVHLEEPEFWVRSGYSEGFKREWKAYYHEEWRPPHSSCDAQYRASKLKYFLYRRALQQVFDFVANYSQAHGRHIACYVPTHSLINYASWRIVSPESSLVQLKGCDGYIAQVWTGTARTPNVYKNVIKERTFDTAFFEYGAAENLVRATGRRVWLLQDPIEDNPHHSWADYKRNYEATLVAALLWPESPYYEVAPWPGRVFHSRHRLDDSSGAPRVRIPATYATELLTVFNHLRFMNQPETRWITGQTGVGLVISDTLMFQRGDPDPSDAHLSNFFGLALPLFKRGVALQPVQLENVTVPDYLAPFKVLFLTYEGQKALSPAYHEALADWVKAGGVLVYVDDLQDPYNKVTEWWNSDGRDYPTCAAHLFELLGLPAKPAPGMHEVGKGKLLYAAESPTALAYSTTGDEYVAGLAKTAFDLAGLAWQPSNHLVLQRGSYLVAAGLEESPIEGVKVLKGEYVNLFSPTLEIQREIELRPGSRYFLLDLHKLASGPQVVASASRINEEKAGPHFLQFESEGPAGVTCVTRLKLPAAPVQVLISGGKGPDRLEWDASSHTFLLQYANTAKPRFVSVRW